MEGVGEGDRAQLRAQILYYIAENLAARADEFARRVDAHDRRAATTEASREVDASISRLFTYAAWADKYDGAVHNVPIRGVALAMNEPIGVVGIACPAERPLLGLVSLVAPAIAMGNTTVVIPSELHPLVRDGLLQRARDVGRAGGGRSTSSPARRTRSRGCLPSMMTWRRCGTSARATA